MAKRKPLSERLRDKTAVGAPDECWEWQGCRNALGYGTVAVEGRSRLAHRMMWITERGDIPEGMCVLHRCDNPPCCNPAHLFLGDHRRNMADMREKGRARSLRGAAHRNAVLTAEQIAEIRAAYVTLDQLAVRYGVSRTTIQYVVRGKTYRGVA